MYGESRYNTKGNYSDDNDDVSNKRLPPTNVRWYLSITPRFKTLFSNLNDTRNILDGMLIKGNMMEKISM